MESYEKKHMPCPFAGPQMFWADPDFLCQTKNLFTYCGSHKHFVPDKDDLHSVKLVFEPAQKSLRGTKMKYNFWASSKNLERHITFWNL